jgi:hypothetical protein
VWGISVIANLFLVSDVSLSQHRDPSRNLNKRRVYLIAWLNMAKRDYENDRIYSLNPRAYN